jgi:hypothetical protein
MSFLPMDSLSIIVYYESFPWVDLGNAEYGINSAHTLPESPLPRGPLIFSNTFPPLN